MSLLNKASLIQIPSGYKDGTLYSAKPTNGDGDFTFSRGSNLAATRVNSEGLIEKGRENLLLQSNSFSSWSSINTTETGGQTGYDGSSNAWLITKSASGARVQQSVSISGVQTLSAYVKAGTLNWVALSNNISYVYFDVANGLIGTEFNNIDAKIQSVNNGWYRCSITYTGTATDARIYPSQDDNDSTGTSGNILVQDAQLEQGLVATNVITTTTTTAQAGILEDMPRLDYSGGATCPSLLLEPQRSNGNANSEYFSGTGFGIVAATATPNATTSPEGVSNATSFVGAASTAEHVIYTTGASTYNGDTTISIFAKANGYDYFVLGAGAQSLNKPVLFNLANGTKVGNFTGWSNYGAPIDSDIEDYGNGWYRLSVTFAATSGVNTNMFFGSMPTDSVASGANVSTQNGTDGSYIYGAMVEAGSYSTSYIPTYGGSSVTRALDSFSKTGISSLIGQSSGVLYYEGKALVGIGGGTRRLQISNSGISEYVRLQHSNTGGNIFAAITTSTNTIIMSDLVTDILQNHKVAIRYKENDFALYVNGSKVDSNTSGTTFSAGTLERVVTDQTANEFTGDMGKFILFPTALTDAELASLTTL